MINAFLIAEISNWGFIFTFMKGGLFLLAICCFFASISRFAQKKETTWNDIVMIIFTLLLAVCVTIYFIV